jgi:Tol biopolymer transport system component
MVRSIAFGVVAAILIAGYGWGWSHVAAPVAAGPASSPTPTPPRPAQQTGVPKVPGTIAFAMRGDIYVLRDGRYAAQTAEGRNEHPALSPDGATLYFARQEEIDGQRFWEGQIDNAELNYSSIVRKPAAGGAEEIVVNGLRRRSPNGQHAVSWILQPAPSRDGKSVAVIEDDGDGADDLVLWPSSLATPRLAPKLISKGAELGDPSWSPDGKTILTTSYNSDAAHLDEWDLATGGAKALAGLPKGDAYRGSYSADGDWIVYTLRHDDGKNDVHAYRPSTRTDIALTNDGLSWNGVFSPDGKWVAFVRERSGTIDLYAMELGDALTGGAAKEPIKLTRGEGVDGASRPAWSR